MKSNLRLHNFNVVQGETCFSGLFESVLAHYGVLATQEQLLGLCSGWYFRFGYKAGNSYAQTMTQPSDTLLIEDGVYDFKLLQRVLRRVFCMTVEEID